MWDYHKAGLRVRDVADEPLINRFLSGVIVRGPGQLDVNKSVLSRYPMNALPMLEWSMTGAVAEFFSVLRAAGATKGFFIDFPIENDLPHQFWECDLTQDAANMIDNQDLFDWENIFLDDRELSIVTSWHNDFTLLCMNPELFSSYLSLCPINTTLWADENPRWANNFQDALAGALRRLSDWDKEMGSHTWQLSAEFDWQLLKK